MVSAPYPYVLLLLPAAVLARDDFRTRRVSVRWLAALGVAAAAAAWTVQGRCTLLLQTATNAALLLLSGLLLAGCLRLRRLAVRHAFGAGDAVFLLAVTPLFAPESYLRFLVATAFAALVWWAMRRRRRRTVPFVGVGGCVLAGWIVFQFVRLWR